MNSLVVGIDPGSNRHGVALYKNKTLSELAMQSNAQLIALLKDHLSRGWKIYIAVEDVQANKFIYARNAQSSKAKQGKVGQNVGQNKQAQRALCERLEEEGFQFRLFKPSQSNWATNKPYFQRVTGWAGSSNKDTRSAAYFGFLALNFRKVVNEA